SGGKKGEEGGEAEAGAKVCIGVCKVISTDRECHDFPQFSFFGERLPTLPVLHLDGACQA
ncbi:MAG: hypothetical protein ACR2PG_07400, partial [Hyphomicrobiaceae bacterium]